MKASKEVKWTGGEWKTFDKGVNEITSCGGKVDCIEIYSKGGEAASWIAQVMTKHNPVRPDQGIANAHLIAAAPALYAALEDAETCEGALITEWANFWDVAPQTLIDAIMAAQASRNKALALARGDAQ